MQTLEEAFSSGTLMRKDGGVVCTCSPVKCFKAGWGPKASEFGRVFTLSLMVLLRGVYQDMWAYWSVG